MKKKEEKKERRKDEIITVITEKGNGINSIEGKEKRKRAKEFYFP